MPRYRVQMTSMLQSPQGVAEDPALRVHCPSAKVVALHHQLHTHNGCTGASQGLKNYIHCSVQVAAIQGPTFMHGNFL